ncbi:MAG: DUF3368 domain-containing protein [Magnetococcales bacterium]|nr:DUF3368 domain-containing protein [Magnetococcales bacterium]
MRTIIDDRAARRCAAIFEIKTLGTMGLLILAKCRGIIKSVVAPMMAMKDAGLWLSDDLMRLVQKKSGE